jgi:hypothetical protein
MGWDNCYDNYMIQHLHRDGIAVGVGWIGTG